MQTSRYIVKRILLALVSLFAIITITYFLMNLMPGDPFMSEKASEENRAILIAKYGLDQLISIQPKKFVMDWDGKEFLKFTGIIRPMGRFCLFFGISS